MPLSLAVLYGSVVNTPSRAIVEPLWAPLNMDQLLDEYFDSELYNLTPNSNLYKFMQALLGDAGVNGAKKAMLYPRLENSLYNTYFTDLDALYYSVFGFERIADEIYHFNPAKEMVTLDQFQEARRKDGWYRHRALKFMQALQLGTTPQGISMLCEAASGLECSVIEQYKYIPDGSSIIPDPGQTPSRNEIVVSPNTDNITEWERRRIINALNKWGPAVNHFVIAPRYVERLSVPIQSVTASSKHFQSQRFVTGDARRNFPRRDPKHGLWIEPDKEVERPSMAFSETQELVTWLSIQNASATSYQIGPFNKFQRWTFDHLMNAPGDEGFRYLPMHSYQLDPVHLVVSQPWIVRDGNIDLTIQGNTPLGYFADSSIGDRPKPAFWASEESTFAERPREYIEFDLGYDRNFNFVEFEISRKPVRFKVEYLEQGEWVEVDYVDTPYLDIERELVFTTALPTWHFARIPFEKISSQKLRLVIEKKDDTFPYPNSPSSEWSIEVRNLRIADYILDESDLDGYFSEGGVLAIQEGSDVLGNKYRTIVDPDRFAADKLFDNDLDSYWQSKVNPAKDGVESLYLDIRTSDGRASTVDELYIDPITTGSIMHIYHTNEDIGSVPPPLMQTPEDWRLWTPDPSHYTLTRGYHKLRKPITAKYIKIEFTNLSPTPYRSLDLQPRAVEYRTHPTWAVNHLDAVSNRLPDTSVTFRGQNMVGYDYANLGIINPGTTKLSSFGPTSLEKIDRRSFAEYEDMFAGYQTWVQNEPDQGDKVMVESEVKISIEPFQENMLSIISPYDYLNKMVMRQTSADLTFFRQEIPLRPKRFVDEGSVEDKSLAAYEKASPETWFPQRSRHGYRVLHARRDRDIGYIVAIREIALYRNNYSNVTHDFEVYIDNLVDDTHLNANTFWRFSDNWALCISDEYIGSADQPLGEFDFNYNPVIPDVNYDHVVTAADSVGITELAETTESGSTLVQDSILTGSDSIGVDMDYKFSVSDAIFTSDSITNLGVLGAETGDTLSLEDETE